MGIAMGEETEVRCPKLQKGLKYAMVLLAAVLVAVSAGWSRRVRAGGLWRFREDCSPSAAWFLPS